MSIATKVKLDLYNMKTKTYTRFQRLQRKVQKPKVFTKVNNSCKNWSRMMTSKLDLYNVNTNSYTKFQDNISKDCREKSGKQNVSNKVLQRAITPVKVVKHDDIQT